MWLTGAVFRDCSSTETFFFPESVIHTRDRGKCIRNIPKQKRRKGNRTKRPGNWKYRGREHEHEGPLKAANYFRAPGPAPMELSIADNGSRQATLSRDHQSCSAIFRASIARRSDEGELFIKREIDMDK